MKKKLKTKIEKTKQPWYEKNLEKLAKRLWIELFKNFEIHDGAAYSVDEKKAIPTKFGYKVEKTRKEFSCEKEPVKLNCPIKWGFDEEFTMNHGEFDPDAAEHIIPNKLRMKEISKETIKNFDSYIKRVILKLQLEGAIGLMGPGNAAGGMWPTVEDECVSAEKDHAVDYIIYYPVFRIFK